MSDFTTTKDQRVNFNEMLLIEKLRLQKIELIKWLIWKSSCCLKETPFKNGQLLQYLSKKQSFIFQFCFQLLF